MLRVSAFNAQGLRVIIAVGEVGAVKMYVAAVEALRKKERGMKLNLPPKLVEKTSLGPSYLVLYFIPSSPFDGLLCRNWLSSLTP